MGHGGYLGRIFNEGNTRDVSSLGESSPPARGFLSFFLRWVETVVEMDDDGLA